MRLRRIEGFALLNDTACAKTNFAHAVRLEFREKYCSRRGQLLQLRDEMSGLIKKSMNRFRVCNKLHTLFISFSIYQLWIISQQFMK